MGGINHQRSPCFPGKFSLPPASSKTNWKKSHPPPHPDPLPKRGKAVSYTHLDVYKRQAGGSTITQQLIKLTHLSPDKNFKRKAQEAYLAIQLERNWTKEQILEAYLNKINFAYAHGVQAAAQTYFRKDVDELSIAQAAVLAAIPRAPSIYKPYVFEKDEDGNSHMVYEEDNETIAHAPKNRDRALTIVGQLKKLGHINEEEYNQARDELLNNKIGLVSPCLLYTSRCV